MQPSCQPSDQPSLDGALHVTSPQLGVLRSSGEDENPREPESQSSASNSLSSDPEAVQSPPSPILSDITFSESSVDIDEFLGPDSHPVPPAFTTYMLVGDNIDKNVRPREMRHDHLTCSFHYFHSYAVCDHVGFSNQSQMPDISSIQLDNLLPTSVDEKAIRDNYAILVR